MAINVSEMGEGWMGDALFGIHDLFVGWGGRGVNALKNVGDD